MKRTTLIIGIILFVAGGAIALAVSSHKTKTETHSTYVNSEFAIRGFRHGELRLSTNESGNYALDVNEEFKLAWQAVNQSEGGQIIYHGPRGIGAGIIPIPKDTPASPSMSVISFTPQEPGIAVFTLTVTGPGPDGVYTLPSTITATINP